MIKWIIGKSNQITEENKISKPTICQISYSLCIQTKNFTQAKLDLQDKICFLCGCCSASAKSIAGEFRWLWLGILGVVFTFWQRMFFPYNLRTTVYFDTVFYSFWKRVFKSLFCQSTRARENVSECETVVWHQGTKCREILVAPIILYP